MLKGAGLDIEKQSFSWVQASELLSTQAILKSTRRRRQQVYLGATWGNSSRQCAATR